MSKLKLVRGKSYTGFGVSVNSDNPYINIEDNKTADALTASGYFILAEECVPEKTTVKKPANNKKKSKSSEEEYDGSDLFTEDI